MMSVIQYPAPNIVPGLNLTADCFADIFAWIKALTADSLFTLQAPGRYGLINTFDHLPALKLEKQEHQVMLYRCCGITPSGSLINHIEGYHEPLVCSLDRSEMQPHTDYWLLVTVQHRCQTVWGPKSTDLPERPLYSSSGLVLSVQSCNQPMTDQSDSLITGLLRYVNGQWVLADYVPACAQIGALPDVYSRYIHYLDEWKNMLDLLPKIASNTDGYQDKSMVELRELVLHLGASMSSQQFAYMQLGKRGSVLEMVAPWVNFARQISFSLRCLKDHTGIYNLLKLSTSQRNGVYFTPQIWDDAIQQMVMQKFEASDALATFKAIDQFIDTVVPVLTALSYGVRHPGQVPNWDAQKPILKPNW